MNTQEFESLQESKKHTSDDFPYNTYLCSIPLDFSIVPIHWHKELELIVIKKGQGIIRLNFQDYHVTAGDVVIVLPEHMHEIIQDGSHFMEYENIIFKKELLFSKESDRCYQAYFAPLFKDNINIYTHVVPHNTFYDDFIVLVNQLDMLSEKHPFGYELSIKACLYQIFFLLLNHQPENTLPVASRKSVDKMKDIIKYIETHYAEEITISQMAELCYFSESHFMKFFKQNMQTSFIHYLNDYRLNVARKLLSSSSLSVLEIAQEVGFDNISYFNRLFKEKYGITPKQIR